MEKRNEIADLEIRNKIAALNINKFTMYSDPSHGWLEVPMSLLRLLNIEDAITTCSYQSKDGKTIYLEQDVDAWTFTYAYSKSVGNHGKLFTLPLITQHMDHCFVRALPRYCMKTDE